MDYNSYIQRRSELLEKLKRPDFISEKLERQFNLVSAGLLNFLPGVSFEQHQDIFKDLLFYQEMTKIEQNAPCLLNRFTYENLTDSKFEYIKTKPIIFCTWHMGAYRMINHFIAQNRIPFSLVIANKVLTEEGEELHSLFNQVYNNTNDRFGIINAEAPNSVIQMLRQLKKGKSLLIYIDGNIGSGENTRTNSNNCRVSFLEQHIYSRTGIGHLSYTLNVPILPIISYRKTPDDIRLKFFDLIFPCAQASRSEFANDTAQRLYDLVAPVIKEYPEQWEAWLYLYKVASVTAPGNYYSDELPEIVEKALKFNCKSFGIFSYGKGFYLFRKMDYMTYPIPKLMYMLLKEAMSKSVMSTKFEPQLLGQLIQNRVLLFQS